MPKFTHICSTVYTVLILALCITFVVFESVKYFGDPLIFPLTFRILASVLILFLYGLYWVDFFLDSTFWFLLNINKSQEACSIMETLKRTGPQLNLYGKSYHIEIVGKMKLLCAGAGFEKIFQTFDVCWCYTQYAICSFIPHYIVLIPLLFMCTG